MKRPSVWLDRNLITLHACFALCLTEASFQRELKRMKMPRASWPNFLLTPHANATCHEFETQSGQVSFIVCIEIRRNVTATQVYALLVHEAVHIWQAYCRRIGEEKPSAEFEAYAIQWLSQQLMQSLIDQRKYQRQARRAQTAGKGEKQ